MNLLDCSRFLEKWIYVYKNNRMLALTYAFVNGEKGQIYAPFSFDLIAKLNSTPLWNLIL